MSINHETDVLLSIVWMCGKEKELLTKFPELFIADVAENINMEKRGLIMSTGVGSNGKIHMGIKCSINSGIIESFSWTHENDTIALWLQQAIEHV